MLCGIFFVLICLANVGPGQELGRALDRIPNRVRAYTIAVAGSLLGIALFAVSSLLELSPAFWFTAIGRLLFWVIYRTNRPERLKRSLLVGIPLALVVVLASWRSGSFGFDHKLPGTTYGSPYYRLDYEHAPTPSWSSSSSRTSS